ASRYQQAQKDFRTAEYYERTGHPGSAVFYYELTRRRYAGTWYADLATERKELLVKEMAEGKPTPGNDPVKIIQAKWAELFGPPKGDVKTAEGREPGADRRPSAIPVMPAGGLMPAGPTPGYGPGR